MQKFAIATVLSITLTIVVNAGNLTQKSTDQARAVIDAAVEAYGGAEKLAALDSVRVESETITHAANQSLKPNPPWDKNSNSNTDMLEYSSNTFATHGSGKGGGFEFDSATIITGDSGQQIDFRANTATPIMEPDFSATAGPFVRVTPILLIKELQNRSHTSHYLGTEKIDGKLHDVITLVMESGPAISLYFDQKSHRLSKSERVLPVFGLVEYRFGGYHDVDGLLFNRSFDLFVNGEPNMNRKITSIETDVSSEKYTATDTSLVTVDANPPDPMSINEIDDGVYLAGGNGTYGLFVDMGSYVVAVGATAGAKERIAELRKKIPEKPIRYAVTTHHHNDHLAGIPAYVEAGAAIFSASTHTDVVNEAVGDVKGVKVMGIRSRKIISDGKRKLELHVIGPTAHTEQLLVAYLPAEKILFEADHFSLPRNGVIPPAVSSTVSFEKALRKSGLKVDRIVSAHSSRVGTMDELRQVISKQPHKPDTRVSQAAK